MHTAPSGRSLGIFVLTISTYRTSSTDVSGPHIRELFFEKGHHVVGVGLVPDDPRAIGESLDQALGRADVDAIITTGGTGISARDCTPGVVKARLDRELPGFGELFRMLSFKQVGAMGMLSTAVGGIAKGKAIFALPGSVKAVGLAVSELILPVLGHIVEEVSKETPLEVSQKSQEVPAPKQEAKPKAEPEPVIQGTSVSQIVADDRPKEEEIASGWKAGLRGIAGELIKPYHGDVPEFFEKIQSCMDVIHAAGERGQVKLADGRTYLALGYPDLSRVNSKVILIAEQDGELGWPEVMALHRWPNRVGTAGSGDHALAISGEVDPAVVAEERTGRAYVGPGVLFAAEGKSIYVVEKRKVAQWDGSRLSGWEPVSSGLGSLLLLWSGR